MIIYLDYIFLENVVLDFILLYETAYISKITINKKRTIIAAILSSVYIVIMLYFKIQALNYVICKVLLMCITVYIAFVPKNIFVYLKLITMFGLTSIVNVGILIVLTTLFNLDISNKLVKITVYVLVLLIGKGILSGLWKIYKNEIGMANLTYEVTLKLGDKKYRYKGFLDTGNTVTKYSKPVIFAELLDKEQLLVLEKLDYLEVRTQTLVSISIKKAYLVQDIQILRDKEKWNMDALVVFEPIKFSKDNKYNLILNYLLYTEKMGGIRL